VSPRFSAMFAFQMVGSTPQVRRTPRELEDVGRAAELLPYSPIRPSAEPSPVRAGMTCAGEQVLVSFWHVSDSLRCLPFVRYRTPSRRSAYFDADAALPHDEQLLADAALKRFGFVSRLSRTSRPSTIPSGTSPTLE